MALLGRSREIAVLDQALDAAEQGRSSVTVVRGPAGIGKSALLGEAVVRGGGRARIAAVAGVEAERDWGYAALHQLLRSFLDDGADRLPPPQRAALRAAFGLAPGPAPDRFLVGLATLTLLAGAVTTEPLLCVVDDAQWVDGESIGVLAFVARRLDHDGVALLFGLNDTGLVTTPLDGFPTVELGPLPHESARELALAHLAEAGADQAFADRVVTQAGGNPLALTEFARRTGLADGVRQAPLPLDRRLEQRFLQEVAETSAGTRRLLLVTAAAGADDVDLVLRVCRRLGSPPEEALVEAEAAGLLVADRARDRITFRHPLIRSAVYAGARPAELRAVHRALADEVVGTDGPADDGRRAWHLAAAATGPDAQVADLLERAADRAGERGGALTMSTLLTRSAELTADRADRDRRFRAACAAALTAGAPRRADELIRRCGPVDPGADPSAAAADLRLRGLLSLVLARPDSVALLSAAAAAAPEPVAARRILVDALNAAVLASHLTGGDPLQRLARTTLATPRPPERPTTVFDLLLDGHARAVVDGPAAAAPLLAAGVRAALDELGPDSPGPRSPARTVLLGLLAALERWDLDGLGAYARGLTEVAGARGDLQVLQPVLHGLALWHLYSGRLVTAAMYFGEATDAGRVLGADPVPTVAGTALLHAWRGDRERAVEVLRTVDGVPGDSPGGFHLQFTRTALVVTDVAAARYADACERAEPILREDPPHHGGAVLPDLVEAAARVGRADLAHEALDRLAVRAGAAGTPWAAGLLARSRALLAPADEAEALFAEACELLAPVGTDLARTHLLHGEWLRRARRRGAARTALRTAHEMFAEMGAAGFARRAAAELTATGERARSRTVDTQQDLTPQEFRIARLAADGASNPEIATALFISPNTVDYHMRKIFRKLDVESRHRLAGVLPQ